MSEERLLCGTIPVKVLAKDFCVSLVERLDGLPLDDYGLRTRDWVSNGALYPASNSGEV